jgi:hypothetical protein
MPFYYLNQTMTLFCLYVVDLQCLKMNGIRIDIGKNFKILFAYCLKMIWRKSNQEARRSVACCESGFRWAKMTHKKRKIYCLEALDCEGWTLLHYSLEVLHEGLGKNILQFLI